MEAVIFDMDGVLLDTESVSCECWRRAGAERGIAGVEEMLRACIGQNVNDTMALLSSRLGGMEEARSFYARTGELFREVEFGRGLSLMDGVVECLTALRGGGIRLAVASSTRRAAVERQLSAAGILGLFETVTTGDQVEHSKPAPDIYLRALGSLGLGAGDAAAVEDSPNGVRSASAAGIRCVMVPDQIPADGEMRTLAWRVVGSLRDVPPLVLGSAD